MDVVGRWHRIWARMAVRAPDGLVESLVAAYGEPHRSYHTLDHLAECFEHLDTCPITPDDAGALELALWFHDAVYDPKVTHNEERSAAWARCALSELGAATVGRVCGMVRITSHDRAPSDPDQQLIVDLDLAILGAPEVRFDEYETQVRREYAWVAEDVYRARRIAVLKGFASRRSVYSTGHFRSLLESRARNNIRRSLEALSGGKGAA